MFELDDFLNTNLPDEAPEWATSETKRTLYKHVCAEFVRIKGLMESGQDLAIKERKIVARAVAVASDVHYSLLSTRRQPEIHELITHYNTELDKLWNHLESTKYKVAKKPSKATIEAQLREKTAEVERLTNLRLSEALTAALENQLVDNHRGLVAMIEHQKAEIERLQSRNSELSKQLRNMMMAVDNIKSK
jgi:L-asparaginase II